MERERKINIALSSVLIIAGITVPVLSVLACTKVSKQLNQTFTLIRKTDGYCIDALRATDRSSITELTIPQTIDGVPVVEISKGAFKGCTNLTKITLPFIGHTATSTGSSGLFGYVFGDEMYEGCGNYTWHMWTESDRYDDEDVEYANFCIPSSLREVVITGGQNLCAGAFSNCKYLEAIHVEKVETKEIGNYAFYGCMHLKDFTYPTGVEIIGRKAFTACYNCKEITIPETVTTIKHNAYSNCISAVTAVVPKSVTTMGKLVFDNMISGLIEVWFDQNEIPDGWNKEWATNTTAIVYDYAAGGIYYTKEAMIALCGKDDANGKYGFIISWLGDWGAHEINIPTSFTASDGVLYPIRRIGPNVFSENENIIKVNFGPNIEYISANAFEYCTALETVNFGDSLKTIGPKAFVGCNALNKHTDAEGNDVEGLFFNHVENISMSAFQGDLGITKISFVNEETDQGYIKTIGDSAFEDCYNLAPLRANDKTTGELKYNKLIFPSSLESIGESAFKNCCRLKTSDSTQYTYQEYGDVKFLSSGQSENGLSIGASAFENFGVRSTDSTFQKYLRIYLDFDNIKLNENTFNDNVFKNAYLLGMYNFPQTVQYIGNYAFYNNNTYYLIKDDTTVDSRVFNLPSSVISIGNYAFWNDSQLNLVMPTTNPQLKTIGNNAFQYWSYSGFTELLIPNTVETIGSAAFANCSNIKTLKLPVNEKFTRLESSIFSGCLMLGIEGNPIVVPAYVTYLGSYAFYNCKKLWAIDIQGKVTYVGTCCFAYCEVITNTGTSYLKFSHTNETSGKNDGLAYVTTWGSNVYQQCAALVNAPFPTDEDSKIITSIPSCTFDNCIGLKEFKVLGNITSIGESAFRNCNQMTKVTEMKAVKTINKNAFYNCSSMTTFEMPTNCQTIGDNAFANCTSLGLAGAEKDFVLPVDITQEWTTSSQKGMAGTPFIGWTELQTIYFQEANVDHYDDKGNAITRWGWTLVKQSGGYYTCEASGSKTVHFVKK